MEKTISGGKICQYFIPPLEILAELAVQQTQRGGQWID